MKIKNEKKKKSFRCYIVIFLYVIIFVYITVPLALAIYIFERAYNTRVETPKYSPWIRFEDVKGYQRRLTNFYSGNNKLQAYIYGEDNHKGVIVISHGIDWGAENYFAETMYFVDMGWRVFAFDNTGRHGSEGRGTISLQQSVLDLEAALIYIKNQNWDIPVMLYGHSLGGYAVTAVLNKHHDVKAVVSIAGFSTPVKVMHEVAKDKIGLGFIATLGYPHTWLYNQLCFGRFSNLSSVTGINNVDIPVMIIHGTDDNLISFKGSSIISQKNKINNKNTIFISRDIPPNNGHSNLLRDTVTANYINEMNENINSASIYYNGNIPDEILSSIYNEYKNKVNILDIERLKEINDFFISSLNLF